MSYTKTFRDGFTVRIKSGKIGTNCANQNLWLLNEKFNSAYQTLLKHSPDSVSQNDLICLAVNDLRTNWIGLQQLNK